MFRKLASTAVLLIFTSPTLHALGLGEIEMQSALNQPMQAVIELTSSAGIGLSEIKVSAASLEAYQRAGLTKSAVLSDFRFSVEKGSGNNAVVRVSSTESIREPFIEFLLELQWSKGRLLRQYTVLVDPPVIMPAAAPPVPIAAQSRTETATPARTQPAVPAATTMAPSTPSGTTSGTNQYGPVQRSDTLWGIAERVRTDSSVTIYQVMQALLRSNPDAFYGNNVNRMKAGVTLELPALEDIRAMSATEALAEFSRQYNDWLSEKSPASPLVSAAPLEQPGIDQGASDPTAVHQDPSAANSESSSEARLSLVAPEGDSVEVIAVPGDANQTGMETVEAGSIDQQLALATEEAEASRAQSTELQSRVNELEQQIDTMKRLLELKDHALAQMQNQSVQAEGADSERSDGSQAEQQESADSLVTPTPVLQNTAQDSILTGLMGNPLLAGGLVLAAMLLGGVLWATNRQRNHAGIFDDEASLEKIMAQQGDALRNPAPSVNIREPGERNDLLSATNHDGDPLTEADVYLAYGRVQQAEDLLCAALKEHPGNDALHLKLLEVYHASGNVAAFEKAASDYRDGVTEDDERWLKVASMGITLAPQNELYRAARTGMGLSGLSAITGQHKPSGELPDVLEFNLDEYSIDLEDEQDGVLAADDEVTTKLDLARAYIDMDDRESARNILDEVIEEGNSDQKQEAESIIAKLA